uniref:non-specific serine/threonine protein kinase n=1 Tax=Populus trichocarpa TaxID=3694 RepID=A0A2K1ZZ93_POPTR
MLFRIVLMVRVLFSLAIAASQELNFNFTYSGFRSTNLSLDGLAELTSNGLLRLTNETKQRTSHAFYPNPVTFKNSINSTAFTFSTTFVFAIIPEYPTLGGHGIAFVIAPTRGLPGALPSQYLGLFNKTNNGNQTNHVVAVELDTIYSSEFNDIDDNHVGIDINGLESERSASAGYYSQLNGKLTNLTLISGHPMQVWMEYDGKEKQLDVTIAPIDVDKPSRPLLTLSCDLSPILNSSMYIGFSSSTGSVFTSHYVLGWSFKMNGLAEALHISRLPKLPRVGPKKTSKFLTIELPVLCLSLVLVAVSSTSYAIRRTRKFAEVLEDWELDYGPHRFKYKDLYTATKGFRDEELLGSGGFGRVYKGVLPTSKIQIAVKRVSHESRQGMREFVAEIVSIGRLRHRNLVPLLGYCRRRGELLLVYDYMPNGSLDKYLYDQPTVALNWSQRFRVINGVASGLFYLHEEWEQVVIHRDVKASNVLLDRELNGRLGDFGLARLYDHGTDPQTTHVVGTLGYLAPEHARTGKATTSTDVFAFGAFLLEVASGRRPIQPTEDIILVDWVFSRWLGARPSMRQVVQFLEGDVPLPDISPLCLSASGLTFSHREGFDEFANSYPSSMDQAFGHSSSVTESLLSGGR